jgi:uncharacterized protein
MQDMYKTMTVLSLTLSLCLGLLAASATAQAPSGQERQQELLRIWYEIREGIAHSGDVDAKYDVGVANYVARGTPENHEKAADWFQRAADRGHAGAHYYLGYMYAAGVGRESNAAKSTEHYLRAAELGHADAQYLIGSRYANGDGLPRDSNEAAKWMSLAADRGIPGAQYYMGQLHELGQPGLRPDPTVAMRLYRAAAGQGHVPSQNRLGEMHLAGGAGRDLEEAYLWFSLADNQQRVEEARKRMTRAQLAAANDRVQAYHAGLAR